MSDREVRSKALEIAFKYYGDTVSIDALLDAARVFEAYVCGYKTKYETAVSAVS